MKYCGPRLAISLVLCDRTAVDPSKLDGDGILRLAKIQIIKASAPDRIMPDEQSRQKLLVVAHCEGTNPYTAMFSHVCSGPRIFTLPMKILLHFLSARVGSQSRQSLPGRVSDMKGNTINLAVRPHRDPTVPTD